MTPEEYNQTILAFNEYLGKMSSVVEHICEDFQESDYQETSPAMPAVVEGLAWIYEATEGFVNLGKIEVEKYQSLQSVIKNMGEAFENKDNVLLRDILEFELLPLLESMKLTGQLN
jgi:hypothetical protein